MYHNYDTSHITWSLAAAAADGGSHSHSLAMAPSAARPCAAGRRSHCPPTASPPLGPATFIVAGSWEEGFYTPPPPGSNFWDCKCARIETRASIHHPYGWWWWWWWWCIESLSRVQVLRGEFRRLTGCHRWAVAARKNSQRAQGGLQSRGADGGMVGNRRRSLLGTSATTQ